jgi:uncharacterized OsmC-like protein/pimeloyl-ACP methyl ester carboxylesterase
MLSPPLSAEKVSFVGSAGTMLDARLERPAGPLRGWALFAHCFACSKEQFAAARISRGLSARGIGVLRFDFTGLGASEGDFANTNFSSNVDDLIAAARWMALQGRPVSLLVGHSLGGTAQIVAALSLPEVKAVVTLNSPAAAVHATDQFKDDVATVETAGEAIVQLGGRPFRVKRQFLDDVRAARVTEAARALHRPLLVMHAPRDVEVSVDEATKLFVAALHPKSFVSLDDADHLITRKADASFAAEVIATWADRYALTDSDPPPPKPIAADDAAHVRETGTGRYRNHVVIGNHVLIADEPPTLGGDDTGPAPYEWLAAGLGACTAITMRMYAERKGLSVARIGVEVRHDKVAGEDGSKIDVFQRRISVDAPDLATEDRDRLIAIAGKCPVHRTLEAGAKVETSVAE